MGHILTLVGSMRSGKNTTANYITGYIMKQLGLTKDFRIDQNGMLNLHAMVDGQWGGLALFDLDRKDDDFVRYMDHAVWPVIKTFSFADKLKEIAMSVFGLKWEHCYGTTEQKNSPCGLIWSDMPGYNEGPYNLSFPGGEMSGRQFLQYFGTEIGRKIKNTCWIDALFRKVRDYNSGLSIITDGRFLNEVRASQDNGAKIIYLTRKVNQDSHASETELQKLTPNDVDLWVDNQNLTIDEANSQILSALLKWGWLPTRIS